MDGRTTWDLLRLALSGLALALSVLLWYMKHFVDSLREAERQSQTALELRAFLRSPRIFVILAGVIGVVFATLLSAEVTWDAIHRGVVLVPPWSAGFWLLGICLATPFFGVLAVAWV